jgi:hypothetical protein
VSIENNNPLNFTDDSVYKSFNDFIFADDLKLMGKMLHRFKFFLETKHLPGDIVEVGVFKGSGVAAFAKFIDIFCPNSNKKVIGFDVFGPDELMDVIEKDSDIDQENMKAVCDRVGSSELSFEAVSNRLSSDKTKLVRGDIEESVPKFLSDNPGFRASLIYMDVDLERPTYHALMGLWDRLLPGGCILFDEYEYHSFSESNGVDRFLSDKKIKYDLKSTDWIAPTCYLRKE